MIVINWIVKKGEIMEKTDGNENVVHEKDVIAGLNEGRSTLESYDANVSTSLWSCVPV